MINVNIYKTFTFILIFGNFDNGLKSILNTFENLKQVANYDFGKIYKIYEIGDIKAFSTKEIKSLQTYVDLLNEGTVSVEKFNDIFADAREEVVKSAKGFESLNKSFKLGAVSEEEYAAATQNLALTQKTATATSKALSIALNTITNVGMMIAINLAIKGVSTLVDKLIVTKEELEAIRDETVESSEKLRENAEIFVEEIQSIDELLQRYRQIYTSIEDISQSKDELLQIQDSLIDKFGKEAEGLDLINGKYDENVAKIKEYIQEKYKAWKIENAAEIRRAEKISSYNFDVTRDNSSNVYRRDTKISRDRIKEVYGKDELAQSLFVIKDVGKDIRQIYEDIDGLDMSYGDLLLGGDIYSAIDTLSELIDYYVSLGNTDEKVLKKLTDHLKALKTETDNIDYYITNAPSGNALQESIDETSDSIENLGEVSAKTGTQLREEFYENLSEMQKGALSDIDKMKSALQTLAEGDLLSGSDFWELMELDTDHIINGVQMVGDKFKINEEQLIQLKDEYIRKQTQAIQEQIDGAQETIKALAEQLEVETAILETQIARGVNSAGDARLLEEQRAKVKKIKESMADYGDQITRNTLLLGELNASLGYTVDLQKLLEQLNNNLDNQVKAFEYRIDREIDKLQDEVDVLNEQKDILQDELDILNEQKDTIQETIDNYKTVADLVQKTIDKRKEELEAEKKSIEDTYNERINKLKEETEQREDAYEYAQKLANLENAKNNKRRVYDEARGWRYESVKEDVVKAENDLAKFENEQAIKSLEKERDELTKTIDEQIEEQTKYAEYYKETIDEIINQEKELLAEQILGSQWREDIASLDIETAEKFRTEYRNHNAALQTITRTEIKLKEEAIKAKDAEIKSKQEQINAWKKYKTDVQQAVKEVKEAQEDYMTIVKELDKTEPLTLENRGTAFEKFQQRVTGAIDQITAKKSEIEAVTSSLEGLGGSYDIDLNINGLDRLRMAVDAAKDLGSEYQRAAVYAAIVNRDFEGLSDDQIQEIARMYAHLSTGGSYANGGVVNYTGLAKLHGSPSNPETVFNAKDSAKLYEMVHNTPNLMANMLNQATKLSGFKLSNNENTTNSTANTSIYIDKIVTNNPEDFAKQLDRYYRTKLTESYTNKQ